MADKITSIGRSYLVSDGPIEATDFEKMLIQDALLRRFEFQKVEVCYLKSRGEPTGDAVYLREALYLLLAKLTHRSDMPERED